jgi:hypothetical protein
MRPRPVRPVRKTVQAEIGIPTQPPMDSLPRHPELAGRDATAGSLNARRN